MIDAADESGAVLGSLAGTAWTSGRLADGLRLAHRALDISGPADDAVADRAGTTHPRIRLALMLADIGHFDEASTVLQQDGADREPLVRTRRTAALAAVSSRRHLAAGRPDVAAADARACVDHVDEQDQADLLPPALSTLATVALRRGELHEASAHVGVLSGLGPPAGLLSPRVLWLAGQLAEAQDGPAAAAAPLSEVYTRLPTAPLLLVQEPAAAGWLVRAGLAGASPSADRVVAAADRLARLNPQYPSLAAAAAHARGLLDGVPELLRRAAEQADPWTASSAIEDLGVVTARLAQSADHEDAVGTLEAALAGYERWGAQRDAARVRSRLRSLGVRRRHWRRAHRPVSGWASLTETERTVSGLVAEGLTNRQIARLMFLSPHTVAFHLRHVYRKLAIPSRVTLARMAVEHDAVRLGRAGASDPARLEPGPPGGASHADGAR